MAINILEVMRGAFPAADRAGVLGTPFRLDFQVQFMWLLVGVQVLIDQLPGRLYAQPKKQDLLAVHLQFPHADLPPTLAQVVGSIPHEMTKSLLKTQNHRNVVPLGDFFSGNSLNRNEVSEGATKMTLAELGIID